MSQLLPHPLTPTSEVQVNNTAVVNDPVFAIDLDDPVSQQTCVSGRMGALLAAAAGCGLDVTATIVLTAAVIDAIPATARDAALPYFARVDADEESYVQALRDAWQVIARGALSPVIVRPSNGGMLGSPLVADAWSDFVEIVLEAAFDEPAGPLLVQRVSSLLTPILISRRRDPFHDAGSVFELRLVDDFEAGWMLIDDDGAVTSDGVFAEHRRSMWPFRDRTRARSFQAQVAHVFEMQSRPVRFVGLVDGRGTIEIAAIEAA